MHIIVNSNNTYKTNRFLFADPLPIGCPGTNNAIIRLARALAATDKGEKNILLRDLKPSNILVSWYGWTKWEQPDDPKFLRKNLELTLIDFGISKEILDQKMSAETNTADRGTPAYIAPEVRVSIGKQTRYDIIETYLQFKYKQISSLKMKLLLVCSTTLICSL